MNHGLSESTISQIVSVLGRFPQVEKAVLFGSRASGRARPDSDVDVGIEPADPLLPPSAELDLAARLSSASGAEVDLVRLDQDAPLLGRKIARVGVCLLEATPGLFAAWRADALSRWIEWEETMAPYRARFLPRLAGART